MKPTTIELSGFYDDAAMSAFFPPIITRRVHIVMGSRRALWIAWWRERLSFDAEVQDNTPEIQSDGTTIWDVHFHVVSGVLVERSEWWRRAGYWLLCRLGIDASAEAK